MKEISLHALDIAQNSIAAGASRLDLTLEERPDGAIVLALADDGRGMSPDLLARVSDPFTTTRTTRKLGLGIPLLRLSAEQTGGRLSIESTQGAGTVLTAEFQGGHIDCPPVGDMAGTVSLLVQGAPALEITYLRRTLQGEFLFDTRLLRAELGPDISLAAPEIALWIRDYLTEQEAALH